MKPFILVLLIAALVGSSTCESLQLFSASTTIGSSSIYPSGSLEGGQIINIYGVGFPEDPRDITVLVGTYPCKIPADGSTPTVLSCETTATGSKTSISSLRIYVIANQQLYTVPSTYYSFTTANTPYLSYLAPSSSVGGNSLLYYGYHRVNDNGDGVRDMGDFVAFRVGGSLCNIFDIPQDDSISFTSFNRVRCIQSPDQEAGKYNVSQKVKIGYAQNDVNMRRTSFSDEYYQFSVLPAISSFTPNSGYSSGQIITIAGTGFSSTASNIAVSVDGTPCAVTSSSTTSITCELGIRSANQTELISSSLSNQTNGYISGAGLDKYTYDISGLTSKSMSSFKAAIASGSSNITLLNVTKSAQLYADGVITTDIVGEVFKGYFYAPVAGNYTFRGAADDEFQLWLAQDAGSTNANLTKIIYSTSFFSSLDNYYIQNYSSAIGSEITLEQGKYYYLEAYYTNYGGAGFFKISVEVPNNNSALSKQTYEIDQFSTSFTNVPQVVQFTLSGATAGTFNISIKRVDSSLTVTYSQVVKLNWNATASQFLNALNQFDGYSSYGTSVLSVVSYDSSGNVVTTHTGVKTVWTVQIAKLRSTSLSAQKFKYRLDNITNGTSTATFSQAQTQAHGPTISGTFTLQVGGLPVRLYSSTTSAYTVSDIPYNVGPSALQSALRQIVGFERVEVAVVGDYLYGATWIISYINYFADVPDLVISASGLSGGATGSSPTISFFETRAYSTNLLFNPVDQNFLFSYSSAPQVSLKVNGLPSVCLSDCTYTFATTFPQITSQSSSTNGSIVSLALSNPTANSYTLSQLSVKVGGQVCTIDTSGSFSSFTCSLPTNTNGYAALTAGNYDAFVTVSGEGIVRPASNISQLSYPFTILTASPSTGGINGGYKVTLSGTGFPTDSSLVTITVCSATANIVSITNSQAVFIAPACTLSNQTITLAYSTLTSTTPFTYTASSSSATISSISPSAASPVQKGVLTISGSGFGANITAISVYLTNTTTSQHVYELPVLSVEDTQIRVGLGGGNVGTYTLQVNIDGDGTTSTSTNTSNIFTYVLAVQTITPSTGVYYGGTLITIVGEYFPLLATENAVSFGLLLDDTCVIESVINSTAITCRTPPYNSYWLSLTQTVIVSGKLIVDSTCAANASCEYTYNALADSPSLTNISLTTTVAGQGALILTGSNLNLAAATNITVVLQNKITSLITLVTPNTITNTSINFTVPNVESGNYSVRVRADPLGQTNSLSLTLQMSITTTSSSQSYQGGAYTISGYGLPATWPSPLFTIILSHLSVPIQLNVVSTAPNALVVYIPQGATSYKYVVSVLNPLLQNLTSTVTQVTAATPYINIVNTTAIASGTRTIQLTRLVTLTSVQPTTLYVYNILTPNALSAVTFTVSGTSLLFSYQFTAGAYKVKAVYANYGLAKINGTIIVAPTTNYTVSANVNVGYLGGKITLIGSDISQSATLTIGGRVGTVYSTNNTAAVFNVPALITSEVLAVYPQLQNNQIITPADYYSDGGDADPAFDQLHSSYYSSSASVCFVGIDVGTGLQAQITKVRFFPYYGWAIAASYIKGAVIQGSNDATTYATLATVDQTVHAGWNSLQITNASNYRYIRFRHTSTSNCKLVQLQFSGVVLSDLTVSNVSSFSVSPVFSDGYSTFTFTDAVTYQSTLTATVSAVSPNYGTVYGNQTITISGTNFGAGTPTVTIDGITCVVDSSTITSTSFSCVTGARLALPAPNSFVVKFGDNPAIVQDTFQYVFRWSDVQTWGTDLPPVQGDLVHVPEGMTLLVDQTTPRLDGIIVAKGKLIFADQSDIQVHTNLITINGGEFRAGTEAKPYQHQLLFVLYGSYYGTQQPMFGNKGIACMQCKFSMHGQVRNVTWTVINSTISVGDTTLVVKDAVDWQVGQQIVVASTDFDHNQAERRTITAVSGNTITVNQSFDYRHVGTVQSYGSSDSLQMRAQVGLLTRNIKMRGDPTSQAGIYGSHLMMAGSAQNGLQAIVAYSEFSHCGQPRIMGRYCIHFHMNGDVPDSYVKGNAVHDSFARVLTMHGVRFLVASHNVGYRVHGHNFFIEDGIETQNTIQYNLVIGSLQTFNMLQSDISVASYWVTNPSNTLRYNRAAGGDFYGFWYEIKDHPDGPSATMDICPIGNPLGQSHDNVAHSYLRFGLRIFKLYSRQVPCADIRNDDAADPWAANPSILSTFYNYLLFKNGEDGVLAQKVGNMLFENFTIAENTRGGFELWVTNFTKEAVVANNMAIICQSRTNVNSNASTTIYSRGMIAPRTSGFTANNIRFYNFPSTATVLQTCAHCDQRMVFTNTANQYHLTNITFTNVTGSYLRMLGTRRDVVYDDDGSFSANFDSTTRAKATIVANYNHLALDSLCSAPTTSSLWDSTLVCGPTALIRSVMFVNMVNKMQFKSKPMKAQLISSLDQVVSQNSTTFTEYVSHFQDTQPQINHKFSYSMPFLAGRIYNLWWFTGIDFTHFAIQLSLQFKDTDPAILFKFNYTTHRELFQIGQYYSGAFGNGFITETTNGTLDTATCQIGDYMHNTTTKTLTLCVTSRGRDQLTEYLDVNAIKCRYLCPSDTEYVKQNFVRLWSNVTQWPSSRLPIAGQNVTIPGEWTVIMNVVPAQINFFLVDGDIIIPNTLTTVQIQAQSIWIRSGSITAGTSSTPYTGSLTFTILGQKSDEGYVIDQNLGGSKLFVVTGQLNLYGVVPTTTYSKLTSSVHQNDTTLTVSSASGWQVGDVLTLSPSFLDGTQYESVTITAISSNTITFTPSLQYTHYGASSVTINNTYGTLDTRAAVGHLTRNIKIQAGEDAGWGFHLVFYGYYDETILRSGSGVLQGVQLINGGQYDTENTALKIWNTIGNNSITITGSSFAHCKSYCVDIDNINNAVLNNNVFYQARNLHVRAITLKSFTFSNNLMVAAIRKPTIPNTTKQLIACYLTYDELHNNSNSVTSNLCQGSAGHGFALPYIPCDFEDAIPYSDNTAGSAPIGFIFTKVGQSTCAVAANIKAYACEIGQMASTPGTIQVIFKNFIVADSKRGVTLRMGYNGDDQTAYFQNSYVTPVSRPTCTQCYGDTAIPCWNSFGVRMLVTTVNGQTLPVKYGDGYDIVCKPQSFDSKAFLTNVTFQNFNYTYPSLPQCGATAIFKTHPLAHDLTGSHHLNNVFCLGCERKAWANFTPPFSGDLGWFGGCGSILCTGKNNYLIQDHSGDLLGAPGTLIANNSQIGNKSANCTFIYEINGHVCYRSDFGVLEYENIAPDFNTRIMWPVYLKYDGGLWNTSTNGWREWDWLGKEPLNKRIGRFISIIQMYRTYNMTFESEPPIDMRFQIQRRTTSGDVSDFIIVKIYFPRPNSIRVSTKTGVVRPIPTLTNSTQNPLDVTVCGSNKFFYKNYTIHFVVTGELGCQVRVSQTNSIQLTARLSMNINDFYNMNGTTLFIDRICSVLQITDYSRVKIVGIYSGSVQVVAYIEQSMTTTVSNSSSNNNTASAAQMIALHSRLTALASSGALNSNLTSVGLGTLTDFSASVYTHDDSTTTTAEQTKPVLVGLIVGVVIGGVVLIAASVAAVLYFLRRRAMITQIQIGEEDVSGGINAKTKRTEENFSMTDFEFRKVGNTDKEYKQ